MTKSKDWAVLTVFVLGCGICSPAKAQEWTPERKAELAAVGVKYGITMVRAIAASTNTRFPPATGDVTQIQRAALEKTLQGYQQARASAQGTLMSLKGGADFLIDSTAITMTATGVGAVPAAVFKATAQIASDSFFGSMEEDMNQHLRAYLKSKEPELQKIAGGDYESLRKESPDEIKAKLDQQKSIFDELKTMAGDDPIAQERAKDMVIDAIRNTSKATLDHVKAQGVRIEDLGNKFTRFQEQTSKALVRHEGALVSLQKDMGILQQTVGSIDDRLKTQERNGAFVVDFVFNRMDPASKAASLKAGFMAERFGCPDENPDCGGPQLKKDLIERFETEARIQSTVDTIKSTVAGINDVATIAQNIGLDIPGLGDAVQYGNIAANAFAAFATGNYLGAIAAVSGVFQKRVDPDAERFRILMGYLDQQFKQINAKLDAILQNQQKMMEALVKLSEQMQKYYVALDERLARMEFELTRVGDTARAVLWEDWQYCNSLYDHLIQNEARYKYLANGDFLRIDDIYGAIGTIGQVAMNCVEVGQTRPIGITAAKWFGNFLSAQQAVSFTPDPLPPSEAQTGEVHSKSDLEAYIQGIHAPSRGLFGDLLTRAELPLPRGIELLVSPGFSYFDLNRRLDAKVNGGACDGYLQKRVQRLLCGQAGVQAASEAVISTPMVVDLALIVSDWLLAASRFADIVDQETGNYVASDQFLTHARKTVNSISPGRDILEKTQTMLDAAVASYSLIYGDLTARAIADVLFGPEPKQEGAAARKKDLASRSIPLLRQNPFLAANVGVIRLHDLYVSKYAVRPSLIAYRAAFAYALNTGVRPSMLLNAMFGSDLRFSIDKGKGIVLMNLTGSDKEEEKILVPLSEPDQFVEGRFIYPARMTALLRMRERVAERLADYGATSTLSEKERGALIEAVARAEQLQPQKAVSAKQ